MELQVGVAKINKYAVVESGDTFEMVERPHGGMSFVLVDGQRSGRSAKAISNLVARKAMALLAEGVRDGAAARAAHDYLYTHRQGQVTATLNIVSIDMVTRSIVVSRNSHCPVVVVTRGGVSLLDEPSQAIGVHRGTKPVIAELPAAPGTYVIVFTDGILTAGDRYGQSFDVADTALSCVRSGECGAQTLADAILRRALSLDRGRPDDDMSLIVVAVLPVTSRDGVRRMSLEFPLPESWVPPEAEAAPESRQVLT